MDYLQIILLGIVQGITEFLPISSSGHLVVINGLSELAGQRPLPDFVEINIALHAGTLLSILVVYARRIARLLAADRRVLPRLLVATLPAVIVGLPMHEISCLRALLDSPLLAGAMLPLTGLSLLWGASRRPGCQDYTDLTYRQALLIGLAQAVAILPGISRSGVTIVAAMGLGLRRDAAAAFSFLLAVIAIGGAATLELRSLVAHGQLATPLPLLGLGLLVSFLTGWLALAWLLDWLRRGRLALFAWWCIPLGLAIVAWQLLK